jgi:hypothetical protein
MKPVPLILVFAGLALVFGFFGWAFHISGVLGELTGGSIAITIMIVAGVVATGALTGFLMWLAFYSSRKGYDRPPEFRGRE